MSSKPLVSICLTCYNQEGYIRQSFGSALSQDYSPLEIVVCDDASSDGTAEIIEEMIVAYRAKGGTHKIVFKRNNPNLGIVKNYDQCFRMAQGELRITAAGDDWYAPNKVSRFVEEWLKTDKNATIIHSGFYEVDIFGKVIRCMGSRNGLDPLGGTAAYSDRVFKEFPPFLEKLDVEDQVNSKRALLLGDEIRVHEPLTYYRVGSGYSTNSTDKESRDLKYARSMQMSARQLKIDIATFEKQYDKTRRSREVKSWIKLTIKNGANLEKLIVSRYVILRITALLSRLVSHYRGRFWDSRFFLDAHYVMPRRLRGRTLASMNRIIEKSRTCKPFNSLRRLYRRVMRHGEYAKTNG